MKIECTYFQSINPSILWYVSIVEKFELRAKTLKILEINLSCQSLQSPYVEFYRTLPLVTSTFQETKTPTSIATEGI